MGFGGPQANVSTGGVRGRGSALPVLGHRCLVEITVPLNFLIGDVFAACAEPTPDNQYTTSKPTLRLCFSFRLFDFMPPALTGSRGVL